MKQTKIKVTVNVPEQVIDEFQTLGWTLNPSKDSPVVSGAIVPAELIWQKDCDPAVPVGYTISCPNEEGYCNIDGIA